MSESDQNSLPGFRIFPLVPLLPDGLALITQRNELAPVLTAIGIRAYAVINAFNSFDQLLSNPNPDNIAYMGLLTLAYYLGGVVEEYIITTNAPMVK